MELPPEVARETPGVLGSLISLLFMQGETKPRMVSLFLAGCILSRICGAAGAKWSGMDLGLAGFMLGMFGMAVVSKIFQAWTNLEVTGILTDLIRKWFGLKDKNA